MSRFSGSLLAEQSFRKWSRDSIARRNTYWTMLSNAHRDYVDLVTGTEYGPNNEGFYYYMQTNYGVKVNWVDGNIGADYEVVDAKKHMLFLIRYAV